ncbi:MAG: Tetratricopeptide repeat-containing protein [Sphaerisporangium sp.]|nr:Tetratricopeptide repeat-containing protein [Sphaerisporangium sp.]
MGGVGRLALDGSMAAEAVAELDAAHADPRATVSRTWELSLDTLTEQGMNRAREVLYLLACFGPETLKTSQRLIALHA